MGKRRHSRRPLILALLLATAGVTGCGGQQGAGADGTPPPAAPVTTPLTATAATPGAATATVPPIKPTTAQSDNITLPNKDRSAPLAPDAVVGNGATTDIAAPIPPKAPAK